MEFTVSFCPGHLSRVVFGFEVSVALGAAEPEHLVVVSDKTHAMAGIDGPRAEVTLLYSHVEIIL